MNEEELIEINFKPHKHKWRQQYLDLLDIILEQPKPKGRLNKASSWRRLPIDYAKVKEELSRLLIEDMNREIDSDIITDLRNNS